MCDCEMFVLDKKWLVRRRGKNLDLDALVRGKVAFAGEPEADVKEVTWPDITEPEITR